MGWFDEQIKQRKISDDEQFQDSFIRMAGAVMGARAESALKDERARAKNAIDEILKYYHYKLQDVPDNIREWTDQLDYLMRPHGLMHRTVKLEKGWYKDACGPMLAVRRDTGMVTALIPGNIMGYTFLDPETGERRKVDSSTEQLFEEEGLCFYKPFPLRELTIRDMFSYILGTVTRSDVMLMIIVTLVCTLVGMISPRLQQFLFSDVVDSKSVRILIAIAVFMICVRISETLLSIAKQMVNSRIESQMSLGIS